MKKMASGQKAEIIIPVAQGAYIEGQEMAKTRGFKTLEDLMAKKFERIMKIYYDEQKRKEEVRQDGFNMEKTGL